MSNTIFWRCLTALILLPFLPLAIGLSLGQFALYLIRTAWRVWLSLIGWGEGLANTRISVAPLSDADDVIQLPLDEMLSDGTSFFGTTCLIDSDFGSNRTDVARRDVRVDGRKPAGRHADADGGHGEADFEIRRRHRA